jgi:uncharacterized protein (TIGR00369 family)
VTAPYAESPGRWTFDFARDGRAEMSWTPTPDMANPFGSVHGGIIATVVDEACGAALMPSIDAASAPTVSLRVEYLHPVTVGRTYTVSSSVVRKGRAMAIVDAHVHDGQGTVLARGTCFFQIPRPVVTSS